MHNSFMMQKLESQSAGWIDLIYISTEIRDAKIALQADP